MSTEVTAGNVGDAQPAAAMLEDVLALASTSDGLDSALVYGDSSYGTADLVQRLEQAGAFANVKVQPPSAREGMFSQDAFTIDSVAGTVCCPRGVLVPLRIGKDGAGLAEFGASCNDCPLRAQCTLSKSGRTVRTHPKHEIIQRARGRQRDPAWKVQYRATRPKVERKLARMMRRKYGGKRARVRGRVRVAHDFALLAAAVNLTRIARLGIASNA